MGLIVSTLVKCQKDDSIYNRRDELINKGGLSAACTYSSFIDFHQYKSNLHCHSLHSDGSQNSAKVAMWYFDHGYQVLSITDHDAYGDQDGGYNDLRLQSNTSVNDWDGDGVLHYIKTIGSGDEAYVHDYSQPGPSWVPYNMQLEIPDKFIILNGIEYSFGHPHFNAIGHPAGKIARPREDYGFMDLCHSNHGIVILDHQSGWNNRPNKVYNDGKIKNIDGLEVMNGFMARYSQNGNNINGSYGFADSLWDGCLNGGMRIWGFANDDSHNFDTNNYAGAGSAWNMIWAKDLTRQSIMEALHKGAFYGTCGIIIDTLKITTDSITISSHNATHIEVVADGNRVVLYADGSRATYILKGDEKWIRMVLWNDLICHPAEVPKFTQKAWLQPIFVNRLLEADK